VLVVDASAALAACLAADGFASIPDSELVSPPLLWPETRSALRVLAHRGDISHDASRKGAERLQTAPVEAHAPSALGREAWRIADDFGWVRAYDAEYVALASLLDCRLLTQDGRLWRGTRRLGFVVSPAEL
jgi:predicted nucleic acid-binding protein